MGRSTNGACAAVLILFAEITAEMVVRFPSPAQILILSNRINVFVSFNVFKNRPVLKPSAKKSKDVCRCQDLILGLSGAGAR